MLAFYDNAFVTMQIYSNIYVSVLLYRFRFFHFNYEFSNLHKFSTNKKRMASAILRL
jgi:hypothetical protein